MRISDWSSDVCSTDLVQSVSRPCVVPFVVVGEGAVSRSACGLAGACRSTSEEGSSTWPSHHPSAHRRSWRRCCLQLQPEPAFFRARSPLGTEYGHACHWDCRSGRQAFVPYTLRQLADCALGHTHLVDRQSTT